jgi:hypothetical protein
MKDETFLIATAGITDIFLRKRLRMAVNSLFSKPCILQAFTLRSLHPKPRSETSDTVGNNCPQSHHERREYRRMNSYLKAFYQ